MKLNGYSNDALVLNIGAPAVRRGADGIPTAIRIMAPGLMSLTLDGRRIAGQVDADDIRKILDNYALKSELIPVDCEHLLQMIADQRGISESELVTSEPLLGEKAAAGFVSLSEEDGALWATFERMTPRMRELLSGAADRMYGYFSPVIRGLSDGNLRITSLALTNVPAINGQELLAACGETAPTQTLKSATLTDSTASMNTNRTTGRTTMDWMKKLAGFLGIDTASLSGEGATLDPLFKAAHERLEADKGAMTRFRDALKDALSLTADEPLDAIAGKVLSRIEAQKGDSAALAAMQSRLQELEGAERRRLLDQYEADGKLTKAMRPWAEKQDTAALKEWAATAPVVAQPRRILNPGDAPEGSDTMALTDEDVTVARRCGLNPEDVAKANGLKAAVAAILIAALSCGQVFATAATANRDTAERAATEVNLTVKNDEVIYAGTIVAVDANGEAVSAIDTNTYAVVGRAEEYVDNSADGETIDVRRGVFRWANGGSFDDSNIGDLAFVEDDQTVTTAASATYDCIAGVIVDVDSDGVWVDTFDIGSQGSATLSSLTVSGAATVGTTLGVTGAITGSSTLDVDSVTVDAAAGLDTQAAGALKLGEATATSVEIADTGVATDIQGTLSVDEAAVFDAGVTLGTDSNTTVVVRGIHDFGDSTNGLSVGLLYLSNGVARVWQ